MAKGECSCGAVKFSIQCEISDIYVCHCSICRRATGSNGIAVVVIDNEHFRWLAGEDSVSTWRKPGHDWQIWFCRQCGAPVPGMNNENTVFIPAASISEGGEGLRVAHHIFVDSRAPWDEIGDDGQRHPEAFQGEL